MKSKKLYITGIVVVILAIVIIIGSKYYPPQKNNESSGTIGVVKKYNAGQMSEKDVKLKNILIKDPEAVKKTIMQLNEYRIFATGLAQDLGSWRAKIDEAKKKNRGGAKDEKLLNAGNESFTEYKAYIEKNIVYLDNAVNLLTKVNKGDTLNQSFEYEKTLNEYENFRIQFAQKFEAIIPMLPDIHNVFVKNGIHGIVGNRDGNIGLVLCDKSNMVGLVNCCDKPLIGNVTLGLVFLKGGNDAILCTNKTALNKETQGAVAVFNKEGNGVIYIHNKDGNLNMQQSKEGILGTIHYQMKDGSYGLDSKVTGNGVVVLNRDNSLGLILNREVGFGAILNKDNQLGAGFTNKVVNGSVHIE